MLFFSCLFQGHDIYCKEHLAFCQVFLTGFAWLFSTDRYIPKEERFMPASEQLSLHELSINTSPSPACDPKASANTKPVLNSRKRQATLQPPLLSVPPATAKPIATPPDTTATTALRAVAQRQAIATPINRPTLPTPTPDKELLQGWIDPSTSRFDSLKNCHLCGWPIKIWGLDHSLCSGDCGWVVDRDWKRRKDELEATKKLMRSSSQAQAATYTDSDEGSTDGAINLFTYGLDSNTADLGGGAA
jgi:predicted nucleic acid-binding Zn ribbon protein